MLGYLLNSLCTLGDAWLFDKFTLHCEVVRLFANFTLHSEDAWLFAKLTVHSEDAWLFA